jgi:hypothetical protein
MTAEATPDLLEPPRPPRRSPWRELGEILTSAPERMLAWSIEWASDGTLARAWSDGEAWELEVVAGVIDDEAMVRARRVWRRHGFARYHALRACFLRSVVAMPSCAQLHAALPVLAGVLGPPHRNVPKGPGTDPGTLGRIAPTPQPLVRDELGRVVLSPHELRRVHGAVRAALAVVHGAVRAALAVVHGGRHAPWAQKIPTRTP